MSAIVIECDCYNARTSLFLPSLPNGLQSSYYIAMRQLYASPHES